MPKYQAYLWITSAIPVEIEAESVDDVVEILEADGLAGIPDCPFDLQIPIDWNFYPHDIHLVEEENNAHG